MEQARRLITECIATQNPYLDLGNCGLTDLRELPELFDCVHLETLVLSNEWVEFENGEWVKTESRNQGKNNQISHLSPLFYQLSKLEKLVCAGWYDNKWNITDISFLKDLSNLTSLNLRDNQITDISFLKNLRNLTSLDLRNNQISDISFLKGLSNLSSLLLSSNQITDISFLKDLSNLTTLELSANQITDISFLKDLSNLTTLELSSNQITDISFLKDLSNLTTLELSANQITDISFLKNLSNLSSLDLSFNHIRDISFLKNLSNLTGLYLSFNHIRDISFLKNLTQLQDLRINSNPFLNEVDLKLEPFRNHINDIKNYFARQSETNKIKVILPTKVLLLGNHGSGKSSLLHFMQYNDLNTKVESTHIINIEEYPKNSEGLPEAMFFDFGGQDFYHGIYRAFLSSGAIYTLLWRKGTNHNQLREDSNKFATRDFSLPYWLGQKEYLEKQKYQGETAPLLLVQTHVTEDDRQKANLKNEVDIWQEFHICLKNQDINANKINYQALQYFKAVLSDLIERKRMKMEEPQWYVDFIAYIMDKEGKGYEPTPVQTLFDNHYARKNKTLEQIELDLRQLHLQGLILYYKDDAELSDVAWLNPKALVQHIHDKILSKKIISDKKGIVKTSDFKQFDAKIIQLLQNQKVLFLHQYADDGKEEYIIPNYLPLASEELSSDYALFTFGMEHPSFTLCFEHFLPMGLINQMICHFGRLPDKKKFWRDQLLFTIDQKAKVLINLDLADLEIKVFIAMKNGSEGDKKDIQHYVFYSIMALYWDFGVLDYEEYGKRDKFFPSDKSFLDRFVRELSITSIYDKNNIPKDLFISLNNKNFIKYEELCEIKEERVIRSYKKVENQMTLSKDIPVFDFGAFTNKTLNKMKKVFISYSHEDLPYRKELQKFLVNLERNNQIEIWQDGMINPGDEWDNTIKENLENADIIILLMSQDFINSTYVHHVELRRALEKRQEGTADIIPVLLKTCDWQNWVVLPEGMDVTEENIKNSNGKIKNYQFMPMDDDYQRVKPLNKWEFSEDAWQKVGNAVKALCNKP